MAEWCQIPKPSHGFEGTISPDGLYISVRDHHECSYGDPVINHISVAFKIIFRRFVRSASAFEKALPKRYNKGVVWNMRKSLALKTLLVDLDHDVNEEGAALIGTGKQTHSIKIHLNYEMVKRSTGIGVAVVAIHEIGHQFGVQHNMSKHGMSTLALEGCIYAAHTLKIGSINAHSWKSHTSAANATVLHLVGGTHGPKVRCNVK